MSVTDRIAIVCGHVLRAERPVRLVVHHSDDDWQFACGDYDHPEDASDAGTVHISHLVDRQPGLAACLDLEPGYLAEATDDGWTRAAHDD